MVGLHLTKVCRCFSEMRYVAMRSISSGGHPCSVESVTLRETRGEMASMNAPSSGKSSFKAALHSPKMAVLEASVMPFK
jgi:hypothetical protein